MGPCLVTHPPGGPEEGSRGSLRKLGTAEALAASLVVRPTSEQFPFFRFGGPQGSHRIRYNDFIVLILDKY